MAIVLGVCKTVVQSLSQTSQPQKKYVLQRFLGSKTQAFADLTSPRCLSYNCAHCYGLHCSSGLWFHFAMPSFNLSQLRWCVSTKMLDWIDLIFMPFIDLVISRKEVKQLATVNNILNCDTRLFYQKPHPIKGRSLNYGLSEPHVYAFREKALHKQKKISTLEIMF